MGKGSFWDEIMGGYYDPPLCDGRRKTKSVCLGVGSVERPAPFFGAMSRISVKLFRRNVPKPAAMPERSKTSKKGLRGIPSQVYAVGKKSAKRILYDKYNPCKDTKNLI